MHFERTPTINRGLPVPYADTLATARHDCAVVWAKTQSVDIASVASKTKFHQNLNRWLVCLKIQLIALNAIVFQQCYNLNLKKSSKSNITIGNYQNHKGWNVTVCLWLRQINFFHQKFQLLIVKQLDPFNLYEDQTIWRFSLRSKSNFPFSHASTPFS